MSRQDFGTAAQVIAAQRRGLDLQQYRAWRAQEELEAEQRRLRRLQGASAREIRAQRLAEQRRLMLFPGDGDDLGSGMQLLGCFVDSLYLAIEAEAEREQLQRLHECQRQAEASGVPQASGLLWRGDPVQVHARGQLFWKLRLETRDWNLLLDSDHGPDLYLQFRSNYLYELGPEAACKEVLFWLRWWCEILKVSVSRIDLAADVAGLDLSELDVEQFVGRPRRRERLAGVEEEATGRLIFYGQRTFTIYLGSRGGPVYGRLYDKLAELRVSGKDWLMHFWSGWDGVAGVSRVECQVRLEFLQDMGLTTPDDVLAAVGDVWREAYGATLGKDFSGLQRLVQPGWCTYRERTGEDSNRGRWPVAAWWLELARKGFQDRRQGLLSGVREKQQLAEAKALAPALAGYLASVGVRLGWQPDDGLTPNELGEMLLGLAGELIEEAFNDRDLDWQQVFDKKLAHLGKKG